MSEWVYLDGAFLPASEARISPMDRGFLFGDAVYELIPVYGRKLFRLKEHLARLRYSLGSTLIADPYDEARWTQVLNEVVKRNPWEDQSLYLQVTRGVAPRRDQAFPQPPVPPTVFVMSSDLRGPTAEQREHGASIITREDYRWLRCDIKVTSLIANCMLRQEAAETGCAEVVLLRDGNVTEGSTSNVFVVKDGIVLTPPKDNMVLPGITYDLALELAKTAGMPFEVRPITLAELYAADEVWLSSSVREVLAVKSVDAMPVGAGTPGPVYRQMYALYQAYKAKVTHG